MRGVAVVDRVRSAGEGPGKGELGVVPAVEENIKTGIIITLQGGVSGQVQALVNI
jgi:hypothetical protein